MSASEFVSVALEHDLEGEPANHGPQTSADIWAVNSLCQGLSQIDFRVKSSWISSELAAATGLIPGICSTQKNTLVLPVFQNYTP